MQAFPDPRMKGRRTRRIYGLLLLVVALGACLAFWTSRLDEVRTAQSGYEPNLLSPGRGAPGDSMKARRPSKARDDDSIPWMPRVRGKLNLTRKDWHNHKDIESLKQRKGEGEQGRPVFVRFSGDQEESLRNGLNVEASDRISLKRSLWDNRPEGCRNKTYLSNLPTVSIIITFQDEAWTTLLRTVHTVLERAPLELVHEVILVDDFSQAEHLQGSLESHLKNGFDRVTLIRTDGMGGLIRSRVMAAKRATGDVLLFLTSRSEPNINYLPPLLEPIALDSRTVVCPATDVIDFDTFAYRTKDTGARGSFDWSLNYRRLPLFPEDRRHPSRLYRNPVMSGEMFAIDRGWFWELGGYDPEMELSGGENLDLSFKIWTCGGRILDAPCSRVGHVYKKFTRKDPAIHSPRRNYKRIIEVWMNPTREAIFKLRPELRSQEAGDIREVTDRLRRLQCKSFQWYLDKVAPDQKGRFLIKKPRMMAKGYLRNVGQNQCMDSKFKRIGETVGLETCKEDVESITVNHGDKEQDMRLLVHAATKKCLEGGDHGNGLVLKECNHGDFRQLWKFSEFNQEECRNVWFNHFNVPK